MFTGRLKSMKAVDSILREAGYLKAWLALKSEVTTLEEPDTTSTVIGDAYRIEGDHVFPTGKEPIELYIHKDVLDAPGESIGNKGSLRLKYKPKIFIKGDGPIVLEIVNNIMNQEHYIWVQDQCNPAKIIQFGCDCLPCEVASMKFTSGQLGAGGDKGYEFETEAFCKYFYEGTLPVRA